jgi:hypothetical protein
MNCKEVYRDFSRYLDGKLPEERVSEINKHFAQCDNCRSYHKIFTESVNTYRAHPLFRTLSPVLSAGIAFAGFIYFFTARAPTGQLFVKNSPVASSSVSAVAPEYSPIIQDDVFELANFLDSFGEEYIGEQLTPLRSSMSNVPVSFEDPAFATFVSEDPSFRPNSKRSNPASPLIRTPVGFAAIHARMERPLSGRTKSEDGLLVVDVAFMSKAFVAGLRKGDVIISFDEKPIEQVRNLLRNVSENEIMAREIRVMRGGKVVDLRID